MEEIDKTPKKSLSSYYDIFIKKMKEFPAERFNDRLAYAIRFMIDKYEKEVGKGLEEYLIMTLSANMREQRKGDKRWMKSK